jgi:hypothetical protein
MIGVDMGVEHGDDSPALLLGKSYVHLGLRL